MTLTEMDTVPRQRSEVKIDADDLPRLRAILASSKKGKARGNNARDLDFVFEMCMAHVPAATNAYLRDRDKRARMAIIEAVMDGTADVQAAAADAAAAKEKARIKPVEDWDNRIQVLAAVSRNGFNLQHASEALQDTKEIVLAAVADEGTALRFASPTLRGNRTIVLRAIERDAYAYYHASPELRNNKEVALRAGVPSPWRDALRTKVDIDMRARLGMLA